MNEQQNMLSDMANGVFAELRDTPAAEAWARIEALGLPSLLIREADGGFGGSWQDALVVFRLAGHHALSTPLVEAILAAGAGTHLGFAGRGTIASRSEGRLENGRFTGTLAGVVAGPRADFVVAPLGDRSVVVDLSQARFVEETHFSGASRTVIGIDGARAAASELRIFALGAFARSAQIAGALDAALVMAVHYVNERWQFGKTLAKFQAVQQNLATFACEAAAANCAAMGAAQALDRGDGAFEVAAAKLRANQAAGIGTAIAHQAHGAIGFTHEFGLHPLTRRLWSWRSEFGGDAYWANLLGAGILARGADHFWADLAARTD
ncbi:acyl-CoA dehydrogenase family protein [Sphingomonas azotifigens]|uniref:acyl-CoA dehydrogenase family protein n=1 Tax=Sphingomonas azotifigens TaxID=330920 RepID=UPI000A00AC0F|nr:acyl-CoA dehydrogenase family protein [Sphingomonas azotifigens]